MAGRMLDLSVVIVSFNTRELLDQCLRSVAAATAPAGGLEVVVVDNASTDGSVEMVRAEHPQVRLLVNEANRGFAAASNQGAVMASSRVLLFLNSDTVLAPESLVEPLAYLSGHAEIGALTVKLVYPDGRRDPDNHRGFPTPWNAFCHFTGLSRIFPRSRLFGAYYRGYDDFDQVHAVDVIAGSFMMMPRPVYEKVGGWDEDYFFYGEDIDLCYRIHQAGYQVIYYPAVEILHYKGASSGLRKESASLARPAKADRVRVARESVRAMRIFYRKFYDSRYPAAVTSLVLAGIELRGWLRVVKHQLT
jgi:GT2 family glycosyltransferase